MAEWAKSRDILISRYEAQRDMTQEARAELVKANEHIDSLRLGKDAVELRASERLEIIRHWQGIAERAEEIAKEASLMIEDEYHKPVGCRFTFTGVEDDDAGAGEVTCWACLVQDKLAEIRVKALTQDASKESEA